MAKDLLLHAIASRRENGENTAHLIERRGVAQCESVNGLNSSRAVPISRSTSVRYDFRQQR